MVDPISMKDSVSSLKLSKLFQNIFNYNATVRLASNMHENEY